MLVTAKCTYKNGVFDNGLVLNGKRVREPRQYYHGEVIQNFDTELAVLANQTSESGFWCFEWPGHEGRDPNYKARVKEAQDEALRKSKGITEVPAPREVKSPPAKKTSGRTMSAEHKQKMADGRARKKAQQAEAA